MQSLLSFGAILIAILAIVAFARARVLIGRIGESKSPVDAALKANGFKDRRPVVLDALTFVVGDVAFNLLVVAIIGLFIWCMH